jgi:hypothetical protein
MIIKYPYEILIRFGAAGSFAGAHIQFREVVLDKGENIIAERLLPAVPFGSDPAFPTTEILGELLEDALAQATLLGPAIASRDAALAQVATLQFQIDELTAEPERPEGKWWPNAAAFLAEFNENELFAIHTSQVPLIVQLAMTLLAWTGEVWAADQRIALGLGALVSTQILSAERRSEILST